MSKFAAYVGPEKHRRKARPIESGLWRCVCSCHRMPVLDAGAGQVATAWRKHVEDEARAAGVEPLFYSGTGAPTNARDRRRARRAAERTPGVNGDQGEPFPVDDRS